MPVELLGKSAEELREFVVSLGEPPIAARRSITRSTPSGVLISPR